MTPTLLAATQTSSSDVVFTCRWGISAVGGEWAKGRTTATPKGNGEQGSPMISGTALDEETRSVAVA